MVGTYWERVSTCYVAMADRAEKLVEFLAEYRWTWEVKLIRFFVDDHWQKIPSEVHASAGEVIS